MERIPIRATLDDWIAREAIPFSFDLPETLNAAVDKMIASLNDSVELLGFGEALHGGEDILILHNRLFQRLVETHGYSAMAIESSSPRARVVNEYVAGRGPVSYEAVQDTGFSSRYLEAASMLRWPAAAIVRRQPQAVKLFDIRCTQAGGSTCLGRYPSTGREY